jgi:hypothetical protein
MTIEARKSPGNTKPTLHFALEEYLKERPDKKLVAKPSQRQPPTVAGRSRSPRTPRAN